MKVSVCPAMVSKLRGSGGGLRSRVRPRLRTLRMLVCNGSTYTDEEWASDSTMVSTSEPPGSAAKHSKRCALPQIASASRTMAEDGWNVWGTEG
jgi:hypothetical protein